MLEIICQIRYKKALTVMMRTPLIFSALLLALIPVHGADTAVQPKAVPAKDLPVAIASTTEPAATHPVDTLGTSPEFLKNKWGIEISSVFLSAGGNLVDFRYRVLDPKKAAILAKLEIQPKLVIPASGVTLRVPKSEKLGPMRQTTQHMEAGKIYFIMFANTQRHVKRGDKATIVVGDFKAENIVVE